MKNRVKELRKNQKLTQEELAQLIGISRQAINAIEKEKKATLSCDLSWVSLW